MDKAASNANNTKNKNKSSSPSPSPAKPIPAAANSSSASLDLPPPPTPQNTPVVPAPIAQKAAAAEAAKKSGSSPLSSSAPSSSSSASQPSKAAAAAAANKMGKNKGSPQKSRPTHEEEDEDIAEDAEDMNELIARNPELAAAIQERLGQLVGMSSGLVQNLPPEVKRRVKALKNLGQKHAELEAEFREELLALERKFLDKYQPLYEKRFQIISGAMEPTDAECEREDSDIEEGATIEELDENEKPVGTPAKGVPDFWLTAMQNHPMLAELITEADVPALSKLTNITLQYTEDNHGFKIGFEFADNEFFTNKVLTKTYYLQNNVGTAYEDLVYSKSEGCTIDWKAGKNLTVKIETKKQRHKGSKKTRIVKREVPTESFFRFFSPPKMPTHGDEGEGEEDEEDEEFNPEIEEAIEQDFELGEIFKNRIIKHAVDWFTGKALENYDDPYGEDDYDDEDDGEGDDQDEDDEDEDDDAPATSAAGKTGEKPADCQQQ